MAIVAEIGILVTGKNGLPNYSSRGGELRIVLSLEAGDDPDDMLDHWTANLCSRMEEMIGSPAVPPEVKVHDPQAIRDQAVAEARKQRETTRRAETVNEAADYAPAPIEPLAAAAAPLTSLQRDQTEPHPAVDPTPPVRAATAAVPAKAETKVTPPSLAPSPEAEVFWCNACAAKTPPVQTQIRKGQNTLSEHLYGESLCDRCQKGRKTLKGATAGERGAVETPATLESRGDASAAGGKPSAVNRPSPNGTSPVTGSHARVRKTTPACAFCNDSGLDNDTPGVFCTCKEGLFRMRAFQKIEQDAARTALITK